MEVVGARGGRIHSQAKVPPGCYLVRAGSPGCGNTVTHWAWVNVGCDSTECVELVLPGVLHCVQGTITGLLAGAVLDRPVRELMPREVEQAVEVLTLITERLPRDPLPPPPTEEEIRGAGQQGGRGRSRRK
jgi:hypothetical protein